MNNKDIDTEMKKENEIKIILASASPRRKELLAQIGMDFEILVSDVEEKVTSSIPQQVVEELSAQKAYAALAQVNKGDVDIPVLQENKGCEDIPLLQEQEIIVIGADTVVACDGHILGKPKDAGDAERMLSLLQGREHQVYTGVTMLRRRNAKEVEKRTFSEATKVHFYAMSQEEISAYVASKDPLDKAGAYGIQGLCARYIRGIEGDYNNVVGLPVGRLYQEIKDWLKV